MTDPNESARSSGTARAGRRASRRTLDEVVAFAPGTVASLRALDAAGSRFLVRIGDVEAPVSAEVIAEHVLRAGRVIDADVASALTEAVRKLKVFDKAVSLLAVRARSTRQLTLALRQRGASTSDAEAAVERLRDLGLLNDEAYAAAMARAKVESGRHSRARVEQELQRRGIAREEARSAVQQASEELGHDDYAAALTQAEKKARSLKGLDAATARRRLYAWLARRGFKADVVSRVVKEALRS